MTRLERVWVAVTFASLALTVAAMVLVASAGYGLLR